MKNTFVIYALLTSSFLCGMEDSSLLLHKTCIRYINDSNALTKSALLPEKSKTALEQKCQASLHTISNFLADSANDPNAQDRHGTTALHLACRAGNHQLVEIICSNDAIDLNKKTTKLGKTPLHLAYESGDHETIACLCKYAKIDPSIANANGNTVLDIACGKEAIVTVSKKSEKKVEYLFELFPTLLNGWGRSTLIHACKSGDAHLVRLLLSTAKQKKSPIDLSGQTFIHECTPKIIKLMLEYCILDPNAQDAYGNTLLHRACIGRDISLVQLLVQQTNIHINPHLKNNDGCTVFDIAYLKTNNAESDDLFTLLKSTYPTEYEKWHRAFNYSDVANSVIQDMPFDRCSQIIIDAAHNDDLRIVEKYINNNNKQARKVALNAAGLPNSYNHNTFFINICKGNVTIENFAAENMWKNNFIVDIIINAEDPNIKDAQGSALIHLLVGDIRGNKNDSLKRLLANPNIDPNIQNAQGNTPLHVIYNKEFFGQTCINHSRLLLNHEKVDPNSLNTSGNSILHEACKINYLAQNYHVPYARITLLCQCDGVDLNLQDKSGNTALHLACESGNDDELVTLLCRSPKLNPRVKNNDCCTVLDEICKDKYASFLPYLQEVIKIFIAAYPNILNEWGYETFVNVCKKGNIALAKLFLEKTVINRNYYFDCNKQDDCGNTIIHELCSSYGKHPKEIQEIIDILLSYSKDNLLSEKIDFNIHNNEGDTPLHIACAKGATDAVKFLFKQCDVKPDVVNKYNGNTIFHYAFMSNNNDLITFLLTQVNIDPSITNHCGDTLFDITYRNNTGRLDALQALYPEQHQQWHDELMQRNVLPSLSKAIEIKELQENNPGCSFPRYLLEDVVSMPFFLQTILSNKFGTANIRNFKRSSGYLNTLINFADAPATVIQELPFNYCSKMIVDAAHKHEYATVAKCITHNNCDQRIECLKALGLPDEYSNDDIVDICQGNIEMSEKCDWKNIIENRSQCAFVVDIMSASTKPNMYDYNHTSLLSALLFADESLLWAFKKLLTNPHINPNAPLWGGSPLEHISANYSGQSKPMWEEKMSILLAHEKIDPNVTVGIFSSNTLLHDACRKGHYNLVKLLCDCDKTNLNLKNSAWKTAFVLAHENNHYNIMKLLLNYPTLEPTLPPRCHERLLESVYKTRMISEETEQILDILFLIDLNCLNKWGYTTFLNACLAGDVPLIKFFLKKSHNVKCDIDLSKQDFGQTILHHLCKCAVDKKLIEIVTTLNDYSIQNPIEKKIDYNAQNKLGNTALHILCSNNWHKSHTFYGEPQQYHCDLAQLFLRNHAVNINIKNNNGNTPLFCAFESELYEIVKLLLNNSRSKVDITGPNGNTALHLASEHDRKDIVELLLSKNHVYPSISLDINAKNNRGDTALHRACEKEHYDIIKLLLKQYRTDINCQNVDKKTPLHIACEKEDKKMIGMLLKNKDIQFDLEDSDNYTAFNRACFSNRTDIIELFLKNQRFNSKKDSYQNNTFHKKSIEHALLHACNNNNIEMVTMLLNSDRSNLDQAFYVKNLIFPVIANKNLGLLTILLKNNKITDLNYQDDETKETILHKICCVPMKGKPILNEEIIQLILTKNIDLNIQDKKNLTTLDLFHKRYIYGIAQNYIAPKDIAIHKLLVQRGAQHSWQYYKNWFHSKFLFKGSTKTLAIIVFQCLFSYLLFFKVRFIF